MNRKEGRYLVLTVSCCIFMLLISIGCNNTQEYKYQKESDIAAAVNVKGHGGETASANPGVKAGTIETSSAAAQSEPAIPEILVADILQGEKTYNNRKVIVSGRIGKVFTHDKMAFLLNIKNDMYVEFSYEQMPESDRIALTTKMVPLQKVTISGVWDGARKVLVADSLISPAK